MGDHWGKSIPELSFEAAKGIIKDVTEQRPSAVIVSNAYSVLTSSQGNLGPLISDALGLEGVDTFSVEASGASGAAAVHAGVNLISSGEIDSALIIGVEKMRDLDPARLVLAQGLSENAEYSQFFGISFAALNALLARLYMSEFGISREKLSAFPVIAHKNSSTAEHAQFRRKFTVEEVSRSELIADPLRVLDCAPVGDGAAALLLVGEDSIAKLKHVIEIKASEASSSRASFFDRNHMLRFSATETAAKNALKRASLALEDMDFFELHDAYSIAAALVIEALGLSKHGEACIDASNGKFDLGGRHPISTFGGMKARGYPVGAAGIYQFCETFLQLTGRAGQNQVGGAENALIHSMSGIDATGYVHLLSSKKL